MSAADAAILFVAALAASIFGSLVGLGGGFLIIPVLRLVFNLSPSVASATSLVMVFANVIGSTIAYLRQGRVELRLGVMMAIGALPGSVLGVFIVHLVNATAFDVTYGTILIALAFATVRRRGVASLPRGATTFVHKPLVAMGAGVVIGIASSAFGIGAGIIAVPLMLIAARMDPVTVSATSLFVVLLTAPVGIIAHAAAHDVDWLRAIPLVAGALIGGSIGPLIAKRTSSPQLMTWLVAAFILGALGLVARHLF